MRIDASGSSRLEWNPDGRRAYLSLATTSDASAMAYGRTLMRTRSVVFLARSFGLLGGEADAEWIRLQSTNFVFVGDASDRQIRRVAQQLEQFREVLVRALPPAPGASLGPIVVIVFANDRSFAPFKPRFQGRTVEVAGFFQGGQDVNFIAVNLELGTDAVRTVLTCGAVPGTPPVLATYRPVAGGPSRDGIAGVAAAIELIT